MITTRLTCEQAVLASAPSFATEVARRNPYLPVPLIETGAWIIYRPVGRGAMAYHLVTKTQELTDTLLGRARP